MLYSTTQRRVVVTGIGAITPLGQTFHATWQNLINNKNKDVGATTLTEALELQNLPPDLRSIEQPLISLLPSQVAAPVRGLEYDARTSRFIQLCLKAGQDALQDANLFTWLGQEDGQEKLVENSKGQDSSSNFDAINEGEYDRRSRRIGTCIGSSASGVREIVSMYSSISQNTSIRRLSPISIPKLLPNSAAGRLSLDFRLRGPTLSPATACAASAHAIGDAMRCIQHNDADVMLAGGTESCIDPVSIAGFCRLRALSTNFNDNPKLASRPFDTQRDGFVMAEGSAILVLEELNHAIARGARVLCELVGYGLSADAHHVTSPDPQGMGAYRAMTMALQRGNVDADRVDYVNAHATSTPMGDDIEAQAIENAILFQSEGGRTTATKADREYDLFVSSTKGSTGHLLGAAGSIEAAFTIMSIVDSKLPHTQNLVVNEDNRRAFKFVTDASYQREVNVVISNSFGFGGTNASLVFTRWYHR